MTWLSFLDSILAAIITAIIVVWQSRKREKKERIKREQTEKNTREMKDYEEQSAIAGLTRDIADIKHLITNHNHEDFERRLKTIESAHMTCQITTQKTLEIICEKIDEHYKAFAELKKIYPIVNDLKTELAEIAQKFVALEKITSIQLEDLKEKLTIRRKVS